MLPVIALLLAASSAIADSVATRERQLLKVADDVYAIPKFAQGDQRAGAFFDSSIRDSFVELAYNERKQR